jgi:hypothetical protein
MTQVVQSFDELVNHVEGCLITIGGYSARSYNGKYGYNEPHKVLEYMTRFFSSKLKETKQKVLTLVCGATHDGGICDIVYDLDWKAILANEGITIDSVKKLGIVSLTGSEIIHSDCDFVFLVQDPQSTWKVLDENGNSYMVAINQRCHGEMFYIKGGKVSESEIREALEKKVPVTLVEDGFIGPCPEKIAESNPMRADQLREQYIDGEYDNREDNTSTLLSHPDVKILRDLE